MSCPSRKEIKIEEGQEDSLSSKFLSSKSKDKSSASFLLIISLCLLPDKVLLTESYTLSSQVSNAVLLG